MNFAPVTLTDRAVEEVEHIMNNKKIPEGYGLRVGIKGSGSCVGFTYMLGFDKKQENDVEFTIGDNIPVYVEKKHAMYLVGLEVDFYEGSDARGFTFVKADEAKPA